MLKCSVDTIIRLEKKALKSAIIPGIGRVRYNAAKVAKIFKLGCLLFLLFTGCDRAQYRSHGKCQIEVQIGPFGMASTEWDRYDASNVVVSKNGVLMFDDLGEPDGEGSFCRVVVLPATACKIEEQNE